MPYVVQPGVKRRRIFAAQDPPEPHGKSPHGGEVGKLLLQQIHLAGLSRRQLWPRGHAQYGGRDWRHRGRGLGAGIVSLLMRDRQGVVASPCAQQFFQRSAASSVALLAKVLQEGPAIPATLSPALRQERPRTARSRSAVAPFDVAPAKCRLLPTSPPCASSARFSVTIAARLFPLLLQTLHRSEAVQPYEPTPVPAQLLLLPLEARTRHPAGIFVLELHKFRRAAQLPLDGEPQVSAPGGTGRRPGAPAVRPGVLPGHTARSDPG